MVRQFSYKNVSNCMNFKSIARFFFIFFHFRNNIAIPATVINAPAIEIIDNFSL